MKKFVSVILSFAMVVSLIFTTNVFADEGIKIQINGVEQVYDQMPVIVNGRTLVPMRGIFEALGADVEWIDATKTVVGSRDRQYVKLRLDSDTVYINGIEQEKKLDVPATIINGRTMVPVRFIAETLGETVEWDDSTKTVKITSDYLTKVAVSDKLAVLPSTMHRPIPTEFATSNDWNDLTFYDSVVGNENESDIKVVPGAEIFSPEQFISNASFETPEKIIETPYGKFEEIDVEGQSFDKAIRVITHTVPEKTNLHVLKYGRAIENKFNKGDDLTFSCQARLTDGGQDGSGRIWISLQHPETFDKVFWHSLEVTKEWQTFTITGIAREKYDDFAIRFGYCDAPQTIEIGDVKIIDEGCDRGKGLEKDAAWRKEAIERIKQIRMGDFKVVVKDSEGNVIPDADVNFDMFESAIPLGTCTNPDMLRSEKQSPYFSSFFNCAVLEHWTKWGPYEEDGGEQARYSVNRARELGAIYMRGHVMIFDYPKTPSGTVLLPDDLVANYDNVDFADLRIKDWIYKISDDFAGEIYEWDVANEILGHEAASAGSVYGNLTPKYYDKIFKWAREVNPESKLFLVEGRGMFRNQQGFEQIADNLKANEHSFDAIGIQSHHSEIWLSPEELDALYTHLAEKYNCTITLSEYTQEYGDEGYNGNYTRDFVISALANKYVNGICLWNFRKTNSDLDPIMMDAEYNLRPGGEQLLDIFYNKMWTHDAKAKTDAEGTGVIRGYYGNYDVTVTHNGKTKTIMAAFHPGYENVLEIVIDK